MAIKHLLLVLSTVCFVYCENSNTNGTKKVSQETSSFRRSREIRSYLGLVSCAMKYDVSCFVDAAEDYLEYRRTELLAQADAEALRSTGRSDLENRPSYLANTLGRLISELTGMFQNGFSGFFKFGREAAADDEDDSDQQVDGNELTDTTTSVTNGVARASRKISRGHKKHKEGIITKIVRIVKYALYSLVFAIKLFAVLFMFNAFVNFKLLLVAMWGVALLAVKVWLSHKNENDQIIIHEDVHHDHHYEDEGHYDHLPIEDWHRTYLPKKEHAQNIAYRGQKPTTSSWTSWLD